MIVVLVSHLNNIPLNDSTVRITRLYDVFSEMLELKSSLMERQQPQHNSKKRGKVKRGKNKQKTRKVERGGHFDFNACPSKSVVNRNTCETQGTFSCCKYLFKVFWD